MLAKCANPACSNHFLYLHEGKLFRFDREQIVATDPEFREHGPHVEFFWLCEHCAADMTLVARKGQGVVVKPFRVMRQVAS